MEPIEDRRQSWYRNVVGEIEGYRETCSIAAAIRRPSAPKTR